MMDESRKFNAKGVLKQEQRNGEKDVTKCLGLGFR